VILNGERIFVTAAIGVQATLGLEPSLVGLYGPMSFVAIDSRDPHLTARRTRRMDPALTRPD
jgi:hypothetical protein